jgi:L-seryl-tRNA(Ser) seleniumtransferase
MDLVAFSGDKLLGGPQAGIIVGSAAAIARLRANPLLRAVRVDKLVLAALGATVRLALRPAERERIPFFGMLAQPVATLRARAEGYRDIVPAGSRATFDIVDSHALVGGGALPHARIPSIALAFRGARDLAVAMRRARPPVVVREENDTVLLDLRTIAPAHDTVVRDALREALA